MMKQMKAMSPSNEISIDKNRVRNHFRNVCFRKKFPTLKDHIKYIAEYYGLNEVSVLVSVECDLKIIKEQTGLK